MKTHALLGQQQEFELQTTTATNAQKASNDGGFWDGVNLMGILNTIGGTWSQIEQARSGKPVYVQNPQSGTQQNIAPILLNRIEQERQQQQTSEANLMRMLQLQLTQQSPPPPVVKDNTLKYMGIGAGVLVLLGGVYVITKK